MSGPDRIAVFRERCEARAQLVEAGELDLHEAVDELQVDAARTGLIHDHGQDFIQHVLASAFQAVPR